MALNNSQYDAIFRTYEQKQLKNHNILDKRQEDVYNKVPEIEIKRDGYKYNLHFEKGYNVGGLQKEEYTGRDTGTKIRWKPDLDVFTDINIPTDYFIDTLKRQAIVNDGLVFVFREQQGNRFIQQEIVYKNGITDYVNEIVGEEKMANVKLNFMKKYVVFLMVLCFVSFAKANEWTFSAKGLVGAYYGVSETKGKNKYPNLCSYCDTYINKTNRNICMVNVICVIT